MAGKTLKPCAIRDPIHEWIKVSGEEKALIDQPLVQRLRHTCQLSGADLVFPGGVHNRFSHVLGVMHTAGEFARVLYPNDPHRVQVARLAGLLHDIGHGPFSHAYDSAVYQQIYNVDHHGHDIHRKTIIFHPPLAEAIRRCGVELQEVLDVWEGRDRVIAAITQGPVGADRIDFLMRDSYYTGTSQLGNVLPHRIMGGIRIVKDPVDGKDTIAYVEKVMDDVINLLLSRVHMYKAVYNNKVCSAVMLIIEKMLVHASKPLKLVERTHDLTQFAFLSDATVLGEIMSLPGNTLDERLAKHYCQCFLMRRLPKMVYEKIIPTSQLEDPELKREWEDVMAKYRFQSRTKDNGEEEQVEMHVQLVRSATLSPIDKQGFEKRHIYVLAKPSGLRQPTAETGSSEEELFSIDRYLKETNYLYGLMVGDGYYVIVRIFVGETPNV